MRVGIINVTGYAGAELARLLSFHPEAHLTSITGRSAASKKLADVFPHLWQMDMTIKPELGDVDFVFSALPHAASAEAVAPLVKSGLPVVDISADFRLRDVSEYETWYKTPHPAKELLSQATYGLTELYRDRISDSRLVANPGCYPTAAILAIAPAIKAGIIEPDIVIDSKSGMSGAGRTLGLDYHYAEANENVSAYGLNGHRHLPEIIQEIKAIGGGATPRVTFVPHHIPMTRGILSTCYANLIADKLAPGERSQAEVLELFQAFYQGEAFVRVLDTPPQTKHTWGNNLCLIYPTVDLRTGRLVVVSCLDNLVKGAAGQAIQNMNAMMGFPEALGIDQPAVYP